MSNTTSTNRKPTKRDRYNELLAIPAVAENAELVEFINHEIELLDKKNSAERKPTAKQKENAGVKSAIVEWMDEGVSYDAATITKTCPACAGMSVNKVSALLAQLGKDEVIVVSEDKRKHTYALA